jgi:hypothetical protein
MTTIENLDTRLAETNKLIRKLGSESAHSVLAKPKMALAIVQARADGILSDTDGQSTYDTYLEGRRNVLGKNPLGAGAEDAGSVKANVSKNTQLLKAAGLPGVDFPNVLERTTALRSTLLQADEKVKPMYDCYVDVARGQIKEPDAALSDDAIIAVIKKADKAEKELVDKLIAAYKAARKLEEQLPIEAMTSVVDGYKAAIVEAGGEVPPIGDDEKKEAEAIGFMMSKGFTLEQAQKLLASKAQ